MKKTISVILSLTLACLFVLNCTTALATIPKGFWLPEAPKTTLSGFMPGMITSSDGEDIVTTETMYGMEVMTIYGDEISSVVATEAVYGLEVIAVYGESLTVNGITLPEKSAALLIGPIDTEYWLTGENGWIRPWVVHADAYGLYGPLSALSELIGGDVY